MDADYSRNTASVLENVIWPDISTLSEYLNSRFTFCLHRSFIIRMNTSRYRRNWSIFSACYMKNSLKPGCLPQEIRIPPSAKSRKRILLFTALFTALPLSFSLCKGKWDFRSFKRLTGTDKYTADYCYRKSKEWRELFICVCGKWCFADETFVRRHCLQL